MILSHLVLRMASVKKHLPILTLVKDAKPKLRKTILLNCDLSLIKTINECVYNTLLGNIPLNDSEKEKLKKFKTVLRKILKTDACLKKKRKVILQSGGSFLPTLLAPIVTAANHSLTEK